MDDSGIINTLSCLASSKTKERNSALDELTTILKQTPDRIPTKALPSTTETLVELLDEEHRKYSDLLASFSESKTSKLSLSENKLSTIAYVLRLFIEKTCSRFKLKTLKLLLAVLPELMIKERSKSLLEPVSVHLTFALHALVKSELFQLKFAIHQWVSLVDIVCLYLVERIKVSFSDRNVSNFISILNLLLSMDTIGLQQVSKTLHRTILHYLQLNKKQDVNTRTVICLVNQLVVKTHCMNILDTLELIKETWSHVLAVDIVTNEAVQHELSFLDVYASELIRQEIPNMIGHEEVETETYKVSYLSTCREYLISRLSGYRSGSLSVEFMRFSDEVLDKISWFEFDDFQLKETAEPFGWLRLLGITKMLLSYYEIFRPNELNEHIFKKRRCEAQFGSIMRNSQSLEDFICNGMEYGTVEMQIITLQICTFCTSLKDIDCDSTIRLKDLVFQKFENVDMIGWACMALIPIISQKHLPFHEDDLNRLFKLCIPLVKQAELCPVVCILLARGIKYSSSSVTDRTTLSQIYDLYELSDVNGPSLLCNNAFTFWECLQHYGNEFEFRTGVTASNRVVEWLKSKWNQIGELQDEQNCLHDFIAWLSNRNRQEEKAKHSNGKSKHLRTFEWKCSWEQQFFIWENHNEQRRFLLKTAFFKKHLKVIDGNYKLANAEVNIAAVNEILYRLLSLIESESALPSLAKVKWIFQLLRVIDHLSGDSNYLDYVMDFKRVVSLVLPTIKLTDKKSFGVFFKCVLSSDMPNVNHLVFEEFRNNSFIDDFRQVLLQNNYKSDTAINDFDAIFDRETFNMKSYSSTFIANPYCSSDIELSITAFFHILDQMKNQDPSSSLEIILDFSNDIDADIFFYCLTPIINWLAIRNESESWDHCLLERLTQLLSEHLLQSKYNISSSAIFLLCSYLDAIRYQWLNTLETPLNADCNDILDWIISRFEDCSFSGSLAILRLSQLLLRMLEFHDLSRSRVKGGKQRIFATFSKCMQILDKASMVKELPRIAEYMCTVSSKNRDIILSEFKALLDTPQQSIEMSAFYSLGMFKLSLVSYSNLIFAIEDMVAYASFEHTRAYIIPAMQEMALHLGLRHLTELFHICRYDILRLWCGKITSQDIILKEQWDIELFGFENLYDFMRIYTSELTAAYFSTSPNSSRILEEVKSIIDKSDMQLLLDSYHLSVPLSFVEGGIGDAIFDLSKDITGKAYQKLQKHHILVYKCILRFSDLGSAIETRAMLERFYPHSSNIKSLFFTPKITCRYQFPLHISLPIGMNLLRKRFGERPILIGDLHIILLWILTDIEESVFFAERLRCIRELKCIFVIYEDIIPQCEFLPGFLSILSQYLRDLKLHDEVMDIIIYLLKLAGEKDIPVVDALPAIFSEVLIYMKIHQKEVTEAFKTVMQDITTWKLPFEKSWKYFNVFIQGQVVHNDIYANTELLDNSICSRDKLLFLSLLFSHARTPEQSDVTDRPSTHLVRNLLKFEVPNEYISRNFQLWMAYSLDTFGSSNEAGGLIETPEVISRRNYADYFKNFGSLEYLLKEFLDFDDQSIRINSCKAQFLWESLLAVFVDAYETRQDEIMVISSEVYEKYKGRCALIDEEALLLIHTTPEKHCNMEEYISGQYLSHHICHTSWLLQFDYALLHHLTLNIPHIRLLYFLCKVSIAFAENTLPILFNLVMYFDHKKGVEWAISMFSQIDTLPKSYEGKAKVNSVLRIIRMLRTGHRLNERHCVSAYSALPLQSLYEAALKSGQITFAYMIFEELYMPDLSQLNIKALGSIYESLGDMDFIAGLPTAPTLLGALHSINKIEPKTWKCFSFNNAKLDAQFGHSSEPEHDSLLKAAEYQGFYGLATSLSKHMLSSETNSSYKWALQLGNWNLPIPERIDTKEKGLYYTLKKVSYEALYPFKTIEESLIKLVQSKHLFSKQVEWINTISEVSLLKSYAYSLRSVEDTVSILKRMFTTDSNMLEDCDLEEYKPNMQSRYMLSVLLLSKKSNEQLINPLEIKTAASIQLANNVKISIENKASQDALKNAMLMDNLVQSVDNSHPGSSSSAVERLHLHASATALWECGDFKTPIKIMRNLLVHHEVSIDDDTTKKFGTLLEVSNDNIKALLVKWTSESRLETAFTIFEKYIDNFEITIKDHDSRADVFYILGNFLNTQLRKLENSGEIQERQRRCDSGSSESQALEMIFNNTTLPENERKDAKRHLNRVRIQLNSDMEILNNLLVQQVQFVWKSLHYYLNTLVFTNKYDDDVLDKFCGLWFEYDGDDAINALVKKEIGTVPSWKFLPWVNQIASKLSLANTEFQKPLQLTMKRLLYKLPFDSLYSVMSIKLYGKYSTTLDPNLLQKVKAVDKIFRELQGYDQGTYYQNYVLPLQEFCEMSVELANTKLIQSTQSSKKIHLANLKMGEYWLKRLCLQKIPLPTMQVHVKNSSDGKIARPYITSVHETVDISSTGLSLPKIVTFHISDGSRRKVLMKGSNDDLRQDAIMEQVFRQVNRILQRDKKMRKLDLNISTYGVVPLGPRAGIIEYVANSISLHHVLTVLHKSDSLSFNQARNEMKNAQTKSNSDRLRVYMKITKEIKPQLRNFFFDSFPGPQEWLDAKKTYTKGAATTCIVGYILGLGDRHLNNILLDYSTGKPIHIDLGIAFDQGRLLPIPERVPFRLTRDIVDGFGVTGVDGLFRRSCEHTYKVLRENYEKVMFVLNILKWDPLYSWVMSPVKKHKHLLEEDSQAYNTADVDSDEDRKSFLKTDEQNQESYRALKGVEEKLIGNGLSVEASVQELIQQATDPRNLAVIYMGWSPFY